jgi:hypothetical protein
MKKGPRGPQPIESNDHIPDQIIRDQRTTAGWGEEGRKAARRQWDGYSKLLTPFSQKKYAHDESSSGRPPPL